MSDDNPTPHRRKSDNDHSSLELTWGGRSLRVHGLIAIVALFAMLAVAGVPLYLSWYAPATTVPSVTAGQLTSEHHALMTAARQSAEETMYVLMLTDREKALLRAQLKVPRRFRFGEETP